jgi:predicted glycosyltransferase
LFFEPLILDLQKKHDVFVTSRKYREATALIKQRGLKVRLIGKHGGESLEGKLNAECERIWHLSKLISRVKPELSIAMHNPYCARVSFGLGIKHWMYSNAPHHTKVMKLTVPLVDRLFIPKHIRTGNFDFGIGMPIIYQYNGMDEIVLIKNKSRGQALRLGRCIVIRTVEAKASYKLREFDIVRLIKEMAETFTSHKIVVLPRYSDEIRYLKKELSGFATVMEKVVDSKSIIEQCDLFVGSGGTMTTEAVLRGCPTLSINTAPNLDEQYLVNQDMLTRREDIPRILSECKRLLEPEQESLFQMRADTYLKNCEYPHKKVLKLLM